MLRKCLVPCLLMALIVVVAAGCGEEKKVDPYAEVSLTQASQGPAVVSKGFKYKLRSPHVIAAHGHLVLVGDGNISEFVVGRSIADKMEGIDPASMELNVVKKYSPFVHFRCEQVVNGADTVFISQAGAIDFPKLSPVDGFKKKEHDDYNLDRLKWNRTADLKKARDKQFHVSGTVSKIEEDGEEVWILSGDQSVLRIVDPDDGVSIVLTLLIQKNLPFDGGITFTEVENWPSRKNNHICGDVVVDYVKYADKYVGS